MKTLNIGIYLFDQVEVLDFAGPFEVFSTASRVLGKSQPSALPPFTVFTLSRDNDKAVAARAGLKVTADYSINAHPQIDVLIVPGGVVDEQCAETEVINWVAEQAKTTQLIASVCTGAFILGKAKLLAGLTVTTHWEDIAELTAQLPNSKVVSNLPWVDQGDIVTSAGISAGIDMSLHLVERLHSKELALATAKQMQYRWTNSL